MTRHPSGPRHDSGTPPRKLLALHLELARHLLELLLLVLDGAEDALRLGMIGEIVPAANLMDRARELAEIACRWSPTALARTKQAVWESLDMGLEDALEATHKILDVHADHTDMVEGATAFMEKREPNWAPFDGKAVDMS